ncbi:MAG: PHP domain-containing protein [Clostridia bacterium]|nr:PHP domain-containing protein [Clostridia bacterium]
MKLYYDMHIHSCLSPCADNDMLPADIAGMGALNGLNVMALTDHNSCENCPPFFEACEFYGIIPIAGMELTTAEDIHIVCLFRDLGSAMEFSDFVYDRILPINNNPKIFGDQIVADTDGQTVRTVERLLISATDIPVDEVPALIKRFGGICYPAHIDRESNGIISILGDIPPEPGFTSAELHDNSRIDEYKGNYPITENYTFVSSSDAHSLSAINTDINCFEFDEEFDNNKAVIDRIFALLSE